jgi:hypothetical protein
MIRIIVAVMLLMGSSAWATAQVPIKATRLVVFNAAGPNFAAFAAKPDVEKYKAHRQLYLDLAQKGLLQVGGNLRGDTSLGISVFAPGVTREQVAPQLEADALVQDGVIKLDFRTWEIQLGALATVGNE